MSPQEILERLKNPNVESERLLDECRAPDTRGWQRFPQLYVAFVNRLIEQGHPGRALDLAREGQEHLKDDSRLQYQLALAAARGGNPRYAESILAPLLCKAVGWTSSPSMPRRERTGSPSYYRPADMDVKLQVDIVALQGRVLKDRSAREPDLKRKSAQWYERAAAIPGASELADSATFPLINAATMYRLAGDHEKSEELAGEVVRRIENVAGPEAKAGNLWPAATLGEAMLLLGRHDKAVDWYRTAVEVGSARGEIGNLASLRNNLRRLQAAGATADPAFLDEYLGSVVVFTGHMVDSPDRQAAGLPPRFPDRPELVAAASAAIRGTLDRINAKVGYCSLACGGDILFAEAMLERGAELHVVLPFAQDDFLRTSVDFGQCGPRWQAWRERFQAVIAAVEQTSKARVRYTTPEPFLGSEDLFECNNKVLQGLAVLRGRERASEPIGVALIDRSMWHGLPAHDGRSDGQDARATTIACRTGGAADFIATWVAAGHAMHEIDLAALRTECRPASDCAERPAPPTFPCPLKRPVKAMLFADVAGFSRVKETQLPAFLTVYGDYLRSLFASPVGRKAVYANTWGDGLYVVFDSVADAAGFATELVEPTIGCPPDWVAFGLSCLSPTGGSITPFRVGLHAGPVFEITNLFQGRSEFGGQHVNRAARIEPVTVRGCAYASEQLAALLMMEAAGKFVIEGVGVHSLAKDYDRCALYRVSR